MTREEEMAATADRELEQQLMEAGLKLAEPPASLEELLPILDVSN